MKFQMENKPLNMFSLSSLTDIVMLLLIFFLLTSQFVLQSGIKIKLPAADNSEQITPTKLVISISASERIYADRKEISAEDLEVLLNDLKTDSGRLIIRADENAKIGKMIQVIDLARGIGITNFAVETDKRLF